MAMALGGIDVLAFSGGVGENRADVRDAIVERVSFLGEFGTQAVPAREDLVIAHSVRNLLGMLAQRARLQAGLSRVGRGSTYGPDCVPTTSNDLFT